MSSLKKNVYWPVVVFLIVQYFVSSEVFWIIGFAACAFYIVFKRDSKLFIPFSEYKVLFVFLICGTALGFVQLILENVTTIDLVRDIFYHSNPIIFMLLGAIYAKEKVELNSILNGFILSSTAIVILQFVNIVSGSTSLSELTTVHSWRSVVGDGAVVMGISLAIIFAGIIPKEKRLNRFLYVLCALINSVYFVLTLSRTNLLIIVIVYVVLALEAGNTNLIVKRVVGAIALFFGALLAFNILLPSALLEAFTDKLISSFTEISFSNSWENVWDVQANWRGYENYMAIRQWQSADAFSQIFGSGFGQRIYVGEYAYTLLKQVDSFGNAANSIAVLHNGYITMLIKLGVLGVIGYLYFYIIIIKKAWKKRKIDKGLNTKLLLAMGLVMLVQTYFLNGLFKDFCFFPMITLIGYTAYNIQRGLFVDTE